MREMRNMYRILVTSLKGRDHLQDLGIDGRIVIKDLKEIECEGCKLDSSLS
jgi:hypothetical protein